MEIRRSIALGTALLALSFPAAGVPLPGYVAKPVTWTTMLITHDQEGIADRDFARWVKDAQNAAASVGHSFSFVAAFTQCFGGGFLTELDRAQVASFGANSASRYYQPASYDPVNGRGFYAFAWQYYADDANWPDDKAITQSAWDAMNGADPQVPSNDRTPREQTQYLDDDDNAATPPPEVLASADNNYAILFSGFVDDRDKKDLDDIYAVLVDTYGYDPDDVYILYGDGNDPDVNDAWAPDAAATAANLQNAFADWLQGKLRAQGDNESAQVFFWAGDHGNADFPISMSVDPASTGQPGTDVFWLDWFGLTVADVVYSAGSQTNTAAWWEPNGGDVDALAFSDDFQAAVFSNRDEAVLYFSVTTGSHGEAGSDVRREVDANRSPGPDVFAWTQSSNRQAIDGERSLGLQEGAAPDELDALSVRDVSPVLDPQGRPLIPVFYSLRGDPAIYVFDPAMPAGQERYVYFNWPNPPFAARPAEVDALALRAAVAPGDRNPQGRLWFNPNRDQMYFSIGRNDPNYVFKGCDVLKYGAGALGIEVAWDCDDIGLDPDRDDVDGLDLGQGAEGEPMPLMPSPLPEPYPPPPEPIPTGGGTGPAMP